MAKAKARNQTKGKQAKGKPLFRGLPCFAWLVIALAIVGVVVFVHIYTVGQPPADNKGELGAAIVDKLSSFRKNEAFVTEVTKELEDHGFEVDLYQAIILRLIFTAGYQAVAVN